MNNFNTLKVKWERLVEQGKANDCFSPEQLTPGKFCIHLVDSGGESMACMSNVETTGFFDSMQDLLAYLRFAAIPHILDWDTHTNKEPLPAVADAYLLKYKNNKRAQIDRLLGLIDKALISETVSTQELAIILDTFNATFLNTNPEVQLLAWGCVSETLTAPYFNEADEDEEIPAALRKLLDNGRFNENNPKHLIMARDYFESRFRA